MDRDEFMELVYETFADEPDNVLANGIIEAADAYVEHEKAQLSQEGTTSDLIDRQQAIDALDCINGVEEVLRSLPTIQPEPQWISVTERLPDNADHPGAFCPRYQVVTPYGVTEGWYRPHDHENGGQWFALFWFMSQIYEIWNIDFERGDVPKVIGEAPVMEWRPMPEPYKPNEKQSGKEGARQH